MGLPCRLGQPPYLSAPVSRTRSALAHHDRDWRRRCRKYASAGSLFCCRPLLCPAVGMAALLSLARPSPCCCCRRLLSPRLLGWRGVFVSSPPPSLLPWCALACGGHSWVFISPGKLSHSGRVGALWRLDFSAYYLAGSPWVFRHSRGLAPPPFVLHSWGLVGRSGGLAYPVVPPHSRGFSGRVFLPTSGSPPLRLPCPMAALRSRVIGGRRGGLSQCCSRWLSLPL